MKKKVFKLVTTFAALGFGATLVACNQTPETPVEKVEQNGVFYCENGTDEYLLTLMGDKFVFYVNGTPYTGSMVMEEGAIEFVFDVEGVASAKITQAGVQLVLNGTTYDFISKENFKVTFNMMDTTSVYTVQNGKTVSAITAETKKGYTFVGWYKDANFTELYNFNQKITANTTVYARYVENTLGQEEYVASLVVDGEVFQQVATVDGMLFNLPEAKADGKTFVGWWVAVDGVQSAKYTGDRLTGDTTLVAVFASEGPIVSVNENTISWTKVGDNANYTVVVKNAAGTEVYTKVENTTSTTFDFAKQAAGVYTVEVAANGKAGTAKYANKKLATPSNFEITNGVLSFAKVPNATNYLIYVNCGTEGHQHDPFVLGNNTSFDFNNCGMTENGITYKVVATADGYMSSESEEKLYIRSLDKISAIEVVDDKLVWNKVAGAQSYYVMVKEDGEVVEEYNAGNTNTFDLKYFTGNLTFAVKPVADGYVSEEVEIEVSKTALVAPTDIVVSGDTMTWTNNDAAVGYKVLVNGTEYTTDTNSFKLAGDVVSSLVREYSIQVMAVAADAANNSQYSDPVSVKYYTMSDNIIYENGVVTWDNVLGAVGYLVSVNDGAAKTVMAKNSTAVKFDKTGYNKISVAFFDAVGNVSNSKEIEVYVQEIKFEAEGGNAVKPIYAVAGDWVSLPATTYQGYEFAGWYNVPGGPEGNGQAYSQVMLTPAKNSVLYAYWTPKSYEITFDDIDADLQDFESAKVYYGKNYTLPIPKHADINYVFDGWYTASGDRGIRLTDNNGKSLAPWNVADDATVYAKFVSIFEYKEIEEEGEIIGYTAVRGVGLQYVSEATIPATIAGKPVLKLGDLSEGLSSTLTSLKVLNLPDTIIELDTKLSFAKLSYLEAVNIIDSNPGVEHETVYKSYGGVLYFYNEAAENKGWDLIYAPRYMTGAYSIMPGTVSIAEEVFYLTHLTSINIPYTVRNIYTKAFASSSYLLSVTFESTPEGVEDAALSIGKQAFYSTDLVTITLPKRLEVIDATAFDLSTDLKEINVEAGGAKYASKAGVICTVDGSELILAPKGIGPEFTIPEGVTTIGEQAFMGCKSITKLVVSKAVTNIKKEAFKNCYYITEIEFMGDADDDTLAIGEQAFYGLSRIEELTLAQNVNTIGANAFGGTSVLTKVTVLSSGELNFTTGAFQSTSGVSYVVQLTIGKDVESFEVNGVFGSSSNIKLSKIIVDPENQHYTVVDDVLFDKEMKTLIFYSITLQGRYTVPAGVEKIADAAFMSRTGLTGITIPTSVKTIGDEAFYGCSALTEVKFDEPAEGEEAADLTIGKSAFRVCTKLTSFTFPSRLKVIGEQAFMSNQYTEIVLPEGLTEIGDQAFATSTKLVSISIPDSVTKLGSYDPSKTGATVSIIEGCTALSTIEVGENNAVLMTYDGALYAKNDKGYAAALAFCPAAKTSIVIPKTVASIADRAFYGNKIIKSITFEDNKAAVSYDADGNEVEGTLTIAGKYAFYNCEALETIFLPNVKTYASQLFWGCKALKDFTVAYTVTSLPGNVFYNCNELTEIKFQPTPEGVKEVALTIPACTSTYPVTYGTAVTKMDLPSRLTSIGNYAFYNSKITEVVIPKGVKTLGTYTFYGCADLTKCEFEEGTALTALPTYFLYKAGVTEFTIPATIKTLNTNAFASSNLKNITIPKAITAIPGYCFADCASLESVTFEEGSAVTSLGDYSFRNTALTEFTVPAKVTTIGGSVFSGCKLLTSVNFAGEAVKSWGTLNFQNCTALEEFTFPDYKVSGKVTPYTTFGSATTTAQFTGCTNLKTINLGGSVKAVHLLFSYGTPETLTVSADNASLVYEEETGIIYSKDKKQILGYIGKAAVMNIPSTVTSIAQYAFANSTFEEVYIPASVTSIGNYAFQNCAKLTKAIFDENSKIVKADASVTTTAAGIGTHTFFQCKALQEVQLPKGLTAINKHMLSNCTALTDVTIPSTVKIIYDNAFYNDTNLKKIVIPEGVTELKTSAFDGCKTLEEVTLPSTLSIINTYVFRYAKIKTIDLKNVTKLLGSAFAYCADLEEIVIPASLGTNGIGTSVFSNCTSLKTVTIEEGITKMDTSVFLNCKALESITLPESMTSIGNSAFSGSGLKSIVIPASVTTLGTQIFLDNVNLESVEILGSIPNIGTSTFKGCKALTSVKLPESVKIIADTAFSGCSSLRNIALPKELTRIGTQAFELSGLTSIVLPETLIDLGGTATAAPSKTTSAKVFLDCKDLRSVEFKGTNITNICQYTFQNCTSLSTVNIPKSVKNIYNYAFDNCGITAADLENVELLGTYAFRNCSKLEEVKFGTKLALIDTRAFEGTSSLGDVVLPSNIKSIGNYAFLNSGITSLQSDGVETVGTYAFDACKRLTSISFAKGLTKLDNYSFRECNSLKDVDLPDTVNVLGTYVFYNDAIEEFVCPANLTAIPDYAFYNNNLSSFTFNDKITSIGNYSFQANSELSTIVLPNTLEKLGTYAFQNSGLFGKIRVPDSVVDLGNNPFIGCQKLSGVEVSDDNQMLYTDEVGALYKRGADGEDDLLVYYPCVVAGTVEVKENVTVNTYAFGNCNLITKIVLPDTTKVINNFAFGMMSKVVEIVLPEGVESIGQKAFERTPSLRKLNIPSTAIDIATYAFYKVGVEEIVLPEGVETILAYTFAECPNLTTIKLPNTVTKINGNIINGSPNVKSFVIPDSVIELTSSAFAESALEEIVIPESIETFNSGILKNSHNLKKVTFAGNREIITTSTAAMRFFEGCENLEEVILPSTLTAIPGYFLSKSGIKSFTMPTQITNVPTYMFSDCNELEEVILHSGITEIENAAFQNAKALKTITLPEGLETVGSSAFAGSAIKEVIFPSTVTSIGASCFSNALEVENVEIPEGVTTLSGSTFAGTAALKTVKLPESLEKMGSNEFKGSGIISISLPDAITEIPNYAFDGCSRLEEVKLPANCVKINSTFLDNVSLKKIVIPASVKEISGFQGCINLEEIIFEGSPEIIYASTFKDCLKVKRLHIKTENIIKIWGAFNNWTEDQTICFDCSEADSATWVEKQYSVNNHAKIVWNCDGNHAE